MAAADRERWDAKWAGAEVGAPASLLVEAAGAGLLPRTGSALDVAGGNGRNALYLAGLGLETTLLDVSEVALKRARHEAKGRGLPEGALRTLRMDLEPPSLPELQALTADAERGGWDLIVVTYYLNRTLLPLLPGLLAEGGVLLVAHPTKVNLQRHPKPGPAFLLEEGGELRRLVTPGGEGRALEVLRDAEGWNADGHHEAHLIVRASP